MAVKAAAVLFAGSIIAVACGGDDDDSGGATTSAAAPTSAAATPTSAAAGGETSTSAAAAGGTGQGMTLTIKLNPQAVWDDGSPITSDDLECTYLANLKTPGSITTSGYDKISKFEKPDAQTAVISFDEVYAPYKTLFYSVIKKAQTPNCEDISAELQDKIPYSGRPYKMQSWSPDQEILVPNDKYWNAAEKPKATKIVLVPKADSETEINSLKSGEVSFIFPQAFSGITDALNDPNIKYTPGYGVNYEAWWFQQKTGPFSDPVFRQAFAKSVDRDLILKNIYDPIFPGSKLLNCGPWVPTIGPWCDQTAFDGYYDAAGAAKLLTDAGWAKNGDGLWAKDGKVPDIRWVVNSGNARRENTQALMIPELKKAGFNVKADNCDAACYFQKRVPALDYDLAMYIQTAQPDPSVTSILSCAQVPGPENNNQGQNTAGWCNKDADALMKIVDNSIDEKARADATHGISKLLAQDAVMLPLFQFPNIAAWRTDQLGGPVDADAANYRAFANNLWAWQPLKGDTVTIGAEQWPECINPVTECANSSWMVWTASFPLLPGVWDTTANGDFVTTALVTGEPEVKVG